MAVLWHRLCGSVFCHPYAVLMAGDTLTMGYAHDVRFTHGCVLITPTGFDNRYAVPTLITYLPLVTRSMCASSMAVFLPSLQGLSQEY